MERYLSVGIATIVALMATHRASSHKDRVATKDHRQEEIDRPDVCLHEDEPAGLLH